MFNTGSLKVRLQRGLSLLHLGPNEARVYYDFGVGCIMLLAAILINRIYTGSWAEMKIVLIPLTFVILNTIIGIYSRLRTTFPRRKVLFLTASVLMTSIMGFIFVHKNISHVFQIPLRIRYRHSKENKTKSYRIMC